MHGPTVYAGPELFPLVGIAKRFSIAGGEYRIFENMEVHGIDRDDWIATFDKGELQSYNPEYNLAAEPREVLQMMNQNPDPASEAARYAPTGLGCGSGLIKDPDPELERLLDEEDEYDRKAAADLHARVIQRRQRLRLLLAAEFTRCKNYDHAVIDAALDDADVALDFLHSLGVLDADRLPA
jgi:hypothetical protein